MAELPHALRDYFEGAERRDLDRMMRSFRPDARVHDVDHDIVGRDAIRQWAADEVIGGAYHIESAAAAPRGVDLLLRFHPRDLPEGFRARYRIDLVNGQIEKMDLQYA